jgi:beta-glucosidase-like glycosyl hydrolase
MAELMWGLELGRRYLPAFKRSVVQGGVQAVMCSYNAINGVPSCANEWLLGDVLRKGWDFKGMVTGDSGAVQDIYSSHKFVHPARFVANNFRLLRIDFGQNRFFGS